MATQPAAAAAPAPAVAPNPAPMAAVPDSGLVATKEQFANPNVPRKM